MPEFLGALSVGPAGERLYRRVLRGDPATLDAHAAQLGWSRPVAGKALANLLAVGLVHEDPHGVLVAADPRVAIARLVEERAQEIARTAEQLEDARHAIAQFAADHEAGQGAARLPMWEIVPGDLAAGVVAQALATSTGPVLSSVVVADWSPDGIDTALATARTTVESGRPMRSLYPMGVVDEQRSLDWMARFAEVGEQQRLAATPLSEFAIFGDEVVLAVAEWGQVASDTVQIRDPMLVAMFRALFEHAWAAALPVPGSTPTGAERRLLQLLAAGYKDEAIARYLGVALRTVRRHVAALMAEHGVETRFQLGMAAERAGLLDHAPSRRPR